MPQVRCPDCFQEVTVMHHELSRVILCPICEGQIGPLVPPPPGSPPPAPARAASAPAAVPAAAPAAPPAEAAEGHPGDSAPKPKAKGKRVKPKTARRFLPLAIALVVGLAGAAAFLGAVYVLITSLV